MHLFVFCDTTILFLLILIIFAYFEVKCESDFVLLDMWTREKDDQFRILMNLGQNYVKIDFCGIELVQIDLLWDCTCSNMLLVDLIIAVELTLRTVHTYHTRLESANN